ncbi:MAG: DUF4276 family protein [Planctomycetes bacterium]|nr:DUF4276 family protein [Planctomycetota bacterium]
MIRRVAQTFSDPPPNVQIPPPIRVPKSKLLKEGEIERAVELVARKTGPDAGILILMDSDDDCAAQLGQRLRNRVIQARSDRRIAVVLAKREYETWFLAAAESLRSQRGLAADLTMPANPEDIRGAKEWLTRHMNEGRIYGETLDQPALTGVFDLQSARRSDSFDKCFREIVSLLRRGPRR